MRVLFPLLFLILAGTSHAQLDQADYPDPNLEYPPNGTTLYVDFKVNGRVHTISYLGPVPFIMIEEPSSTGHGFPGEEDPEDQWLDMSDPLSPQILTKSCQPTADQLIVDNDTGFVQKDNDTCQNSQPINSHGTIYVLGDDGYACMAVNGLFTGLTGTPVSEFLCYNEQDGSVSYTHLTLPTNREV